VNNYFFKGNFLLGTFLILYMHSFMVNPIEMYALSPTDSIKNKVNQTSQNDSRLSWSIFRPACIDASSSNHSIDGAVGEPFIGIARSHNYIMSSGRYYYSQIMTGIKDDNVVLRKFDLFQNYPNPFNPSTTIGYSLPKTANVSLKVFNTLGQEVAALVNELRSPGYYKVQWNASNVTSGIYFYRLQAGEFVETKKMVLLH